MTESRARRLARWALAAIFIADAGLHWLFPAPFMAITPDWVPEPRLVVQLTGLAALAGGIGLLVPQTRRWAGIGLAVYCVCVFPANIRHAFESIAMNGVTLSWLYHGPRLLLQPVFAWWCLWASGVIDWPFRARA
jgi:uncharacterized membrane protein